MIGRHVQLEAVFEVLDEVGLAAEATEELLWSVAPLSGALQGWLHYLLVVHPETAESFIKNIKGREYRV